jgi:hypothetical protein
MEPRSEDQKTEVRPQDKPHSKRFQIVMLEERIAPSKGGNGTHNCPLTGGRNCTYVLC